MRCDYRMCMGAVVLKMLRFRRIGVSADVQILGLGSLNGPAAMRVDRPCRLVTCLIFPPRLSFRLRAVKFVM